MEDRIIQIYPQAIPLVDFTLQDNGEGIFISFWNTSKLGDKPQLSEINQVIVTPKVPEEVTMRQARLVLLQTGKLDLIESAIATMAGVQGQAARIEWEYSNTLKRNQPLVISMGSLLGLNTLQIDNLFILASTL